MARGLRLLLSCGKGNPACSASMLATSIEINPSALKARMTWFSPAARPKLLDSPAVTQGVPKRGAGTDSEESITVEIPLGKQKSFPQEVQELRV